MSRLLRLLAFTLAALSGLPAAASAADGWTPPVRVSPTSGSASYPALVAGPSGAAAAAVWIDSSGAGSGVLAATRTATGWSAPTRLSSPSWTVPSGRNYAPAIVAGPDGAFTAVWAERSADGTASRIRTSRSTSAGWGGALTLAELTSTEPSPTAAVDGSGRVVAAWISGHAAQSRVQAAAGGTWGAIQTLATSKEYDDVIDDAEYRGGEPVESLRLTACEGTVGALWSVAPWFQWSLLNGSHGNQGVYPMALRFKPLAADGTWAAADTAVEDTGLVSDAGTGTWACGAGGELTVAAIGDIDGHSGRNDPPTHQLDRSATRDASGAWSAPVQFADALEGELPRVEQIAYTADGHVLRATEQGSGTVLLSQRPAGGSWPAPSPLLPAGQGAKAPYLYADAAGLQTLAHGRLGDVTPHIEVRMRTASDQPWGAPTTISTTGLPTGNVQVTGPGDGTLTALMLQRNGWRWELSAAAFAPPTLRVAAALSGKTITLDVDLVRTGASCPAGGSIWVTPSNTVNGVQTNLSLAARSLTVTVGAGATCTIKGTATLSRTPPATGLFKVTVGGPGLRYRTFLPI